LASFYNISLGSVVCGSRFHYKYYVKGNDIGADFVHAAYSCGHICWVINQSTASTYANTRANIGVCHKVDSHGIGIVIIGLLDWWAAFVIYR
jgi:hypothetical protein